MVITIKPEIIPLVPALDNPSEGKKEELPTRPSVIHTEGFLFALNVLIEPLSSLFFPDLYKVYNMHINLTGSS